MIHPHFSENSTLGSNLRCWERSTWACSLGIYSIRRNEICLSFPRRFLGVNTDSMLVTSWLHTQAILRRRTKVTPEWRHTRTARTPSKRENRQETYTVFWGFNCGTSNALNEKLRYEVPLDSNVSYSSQVMLQELHDQFQTRIDRPIALSIPWWDFRYWF